MNRLVQAMEKDTRFFITALDGYGEPRFIDISKYSFKPQQIDVEDTPKNSVATLLLKNNEKFSIQDFEILQELYNDEEKIKQLRDLEVIKRLHIASLRFDNPFLSNRLFKRWFKISCQFDEFEEYKSEKYWTAIKKSGKIEYIPFSNDWIETNPIFTRWVDRVNKDNKINPVFFNLLGEGEFLSKETFKRRNKPKYHSFDDLGKPAQEIQLVKAMQNLQYTDPSIVAYAAQRLILSIRKNISTNSIDYSSNINKQLSISFFRIRVFKGCLWQRDYPIYFTRILWKLYMALDFFK